MNIYIWGCLCWLGWQNHHDCDTNYWCWKDAWKVTSKQIGCRWDAHGIHHCGQRNRHPHSIHPWNRQLLHLTSHGVSLCSVCSLCHCPAGTNCSGCRSSNPCSCCRSSNPCSSNPVHPFHAIGATVAFDHSLCLCHGLTTVCHSISSSWLEALVLHLRLHLLVYLRMDRQLELLRLHILHEHLLDVLLDHQHRHRLPIPTPWGAPEHQTGRSVTVAHLQDLSKLLGTPGNDRGNTMNCRALSSHAGLLQPATTKNHQCKQLWNLKTNRRQEHVTHASVAWSIRFFNHPHLISHRCFVHNSSSNLCQAVELSHATSHTFLRPMDVYTLCPIYTISLQSLNSSIKTFDSSIKTSSVSDFAIRRENSKHLPASGCK